MKTHKHIAGKWIACGVLVLLALVCIFLLRGYDFSGYFFLGLAALIPVYHFLGNQRIITRMLTIILILFFAAMSVTGFRILQASHGTDDPQSDYLIVLGAGVNGTQPSRSLKERLDAAYSYLTEHPNAVAIVSGGQGDGENISEAQCMYNYLTAAGIHSDRIWMEDQATNTTQNLQFSLDVITDRTGSRPEKIAIVSSEYHLYRANLFALNLGLNTEMIPAKTAIIPLRWNYYLREIFAVWYYSLLGGL